MCAVTLAATVVYHFAYDDFLLLTACAECACRHYVATHVECHIMRRLRLLHGKAILVAIAILSRRQHAGDFLQHKHDNEIVYELAAAFCVGKLQVTSDSTSLYADAPSCGLLRLPSFDNSIDCDVRLSRSAYAFA